MKKTYWSPRVDTVDCLMDGMVCASGVVSDDGIDNGILFGGVDENGSLDPASREFREGISRILGI